MGDTIVATPFLRRLSESGLTSHVTVTGGPTASQILSGCPYCSDLWTLDLKEEGLRVGVSRMREGRFDAVFLLDRSIRSAASAWLAGIPVRVGHATEYRGPLLTHRVPYAWEKPDRECALDLLTAIGIAAEPCDPELWVSALERVGAAQRLAEAGIGPGDMVVGMQPGANDPEVREWGAERFAAVGDALAGERGARVVLLGSQAERPVSERVAAEMKEPAIVMTGSTGLREALAIIERCDLWIGNDSGLLNAAVALGRRTVGIYGPTKAHRWAYSGPLARSLVVYPAELIGRQKSGSGRPRSRQQRREVSLRTLRIPAAEIRRCLDAITTESVLEAARELLVGVAVPDSGRPQRS